MQIDGQLKSITWRGFTRPLGFAEGLNVLKAAARRTEYRTFNSLSCNRPADFPDIAFFS